MVDPNVSSRRGKARDRRTGKRGQPGIIVFAFFIIVLLSIYLFLISKVFESHQASQSSVLLPAYANTTSGGKRHSNEWVNEKRHKYNDWKTLAVRLAGLPADEILTVLKTQDPFGVRTFEEQLLQAESDKQAILQLDDIRALFPCPIDERITLPDQRNHELARKYRQGLDRLKEPKEDFVFLFFQHLRKAGGTNFCGLAEHNLLKPQVPKVSDSLVYLRGFRVSQPPY